MWRALIMTQHFLMAVEGTMNDDLSGPMIAFMITSSGAIIKFCYL